MVSFTSTPASAIHDCRRGRLNFLPNSMPSVCSHSTSASRCRNSSSASPRDRKPGAQRRCDGFHLRAVGFGLRLQGVLELLGRLARVHELAQPHRRLSVLRRRTHGPTGSRGRRARGSGSRRSSRARTERSSSARHRAAPCARTSRTPTPPSRSARTRPSCRCGSRRFPPRGSPASRTCRLSTNKQNKQTKRKYHSSPRTVRIFLQSCD